MEPSALATLYQPLDSAKAEIRLLRILHSSNDGTTLHCEMVQVSIGDSLPEYHSLSYEWGPPDLSDASSVFVNSHRVITTTNLWLALNQLSKSTYYWIDFICINQNDLEERARQVGSMTKIYQTASAVEIWLGPGDDRVSKGIEVLNKFEELGPQPSGRERIPDLSDDHWMGFCRLLESSYWTRMWIVQEIVVARSTKDVLLRCGSELARFQGIYPVTKAVSRAQAQNLPGNNWGGIYWKMHAPSLIPCWISIHSFLWTEPEWEYLNYQGLSLCYLLHCYSQQQCADPRDKIYALLGISKKHSDIELEIDYACPVNDVYTNAAKYIISDTKQLDILLFVQLQNSPGLPTWVPDWRLYNSVHRVINIQKYDWNASASMPPSFRFSPSGRSLFVKGMVIGHVSSLGPKAWFSDDFLTESERDGRLVREHLMSAQHKFARSSLEANYLQFPGTSVEDQDYETMFSLYEIQVLSYRTKDRMETLLSFPAYKSFLIDLHDAMASKLELPTPPNQLVTLWRHPNRMFALTIQEEKIQAVTRANSEPPNTELPRPTIRPTPKPSSGKNNTIPKITIAFGPIDTKSGDVITVIAGCKHPVLLRQKESGGFYVIGEVCVAGFMDGQAVGRFDKVEFELI